MNTLLTKKAKLYEWCKEAIALRIHEAEQAIQHAREAAHDDTKSSAGDKYETTREMMQQEIARNEQQLVAAQQLKHQLNTINLAPNKNNQIQLGSFIETSEGNFFMGIALGRMEVEGESCFVISPASPIGRLMLGKTKGAAIVFNDKSYRILQIG